MAYRKPFTPPQRREALRALASYRKHLRLLRRRYAPRHEEQRAVLDEYTVALNELEQELARSDRTVNIAQLNRTDALARWLAMEYWRLTHSEQ